MTPPGTRTKAELVRDYRADKEARGECRDCKNPAKVRTLRDGTKRVGKLCTVCSKADAARKAGQIR